MTQLRRTKTACVFNKVEPKKSKNNKSKKAKKKSCAGKSTVNPPN